MEEKSIEHVPRGKVLKLFADMQLERTRKKSTAVSMAKLEGEEEDFHLDRVDLELRKRIQQARMAKKMTQAELAKLINEKPQVVNEYESGKAVPNPSVLGKMERILGVKLRGKIDGKKKK
eukprot:TRINITY_DN617_c0_g1_i2.p2 TRINITY_DN617_c0_g1~~TRINITY_DN617_c0_g1_i2.p2  ORF type:complete len:120 (-),score=43.68 TRINITY_DN617_c0_g1_i2:922-1281(-)